RSARREDRAELRVVRRHGVRGKGMAMLGRKSRSQAPIETLVGADTRIQGDIEFAGGCHVDGYVKGNVKATKDARAVLSISERGCVEGSVLVPHVLLNGTVKGDVR